MNVRVENADMKSRWDADMKLMSHANRLDGCSVASGLVHGPPLILQQGGADLDDGLRCRAGCIFPYLHVPWCKQMFISTVAQMKSLRDSGCTQVSWYKYVSEVGTIYPKPSSSIRTIRHEQSSVQSSPVQSSPEPCRIPHHHQRPLPFQLLPFLSRMSLSNWLLYVMPIASRTWSFWRTRNTWSGWARNPLP